MSQPSNITDDPLPPADPVTPLPSEAPENQALEHDATTKQQLESPSLEPVSSYGHTDPASLAAVQSHELPDASLQAELAPEFEDPTLTKFTPGSGPDAGAEGGPHVGPEEAAQSETENLVKTSDFSNWDPHLAHLAQVGLTTADHWDEQIKPRIDQLHEDITQVNEQLDDLEKAKPKPKKS